MASSNVDQQGTSSGEGSAAPEPLQAVSHEMRTLLTGVLGCAGLLLDTELGPEQRDLVKRIRASGDALLALVNNVLDFSKADANLLAFEVTSFDLRRLVEEVSELMAERASAKGIELVVWLGQDLPTQIKADAGRIKQILLNLIGNAIKFTDRGEVVVRVETVAARTEPPAPRKGAIRFEVVDSGAGISEEGQAKLFRPFSQVDGGGVRGGTGLGLALSKRLVEAMGGRIGALSELGRGSTFWFELPSPEVGPSSERREIPRVDFAGRRVLVVVPNATARSVLVEMVDALDVETVCVTEPKEALEAMRRARDEARSFDLAIVDRKLGEASGAELAFDMQREDLIPRARIVLLAYPGERTPEDRDAAAVNLSKPVRRGHLQAALRTLMGSSVEQARIRSRAFAAPSPQEIERARRAAIPPAARPRVLVVEDNLVNQRVSAVLVEKRGYTVDLASSGIEAVDAAMKHKYAAIFMDCQMPKLDGYGATQQIRRLEGDAKRTPIIAMTANAHTGAREKCIAAGMDDYLTKPIVASELDRVLRTYCPIEGPVARHAPVRRPSTRSRRKSVAPPKTHRHDAETEVPEPRVDRTTEVPPIDTSALERLRALQGEGDPDIVEEVIGLFLGELPARRAAIANAALDGDMRELARAAHTLKGSAANVGATPLAEACGALAHRARLGGPFVATNEIDRIARELSRAVDELGKLKGGAS